MTAPQLDSATLVRELLRRLGLPAIGQPAEVLLLEGTVLSGKLVDAAVDGTSAALVRTLTVEPHGHTGTRVVLPGHAIARVTVRPPVEPHPATT
jgi:hypothetical protein